jgi:hypothetical protein
MCGANTFDLTYNGWTNWETWQVSLRLEGINLQTEVYALKEALLEEAGAIKNPLLREFALSSVRGVDWQQIAEGFEE